MFYLFLYKIMGLFIAIKMVRKVYFVFKIILDKCVLECCKMIFIFGVFGPCSLNIYALLDK